MKERRTCEYCKKSFIFRFKPSSRNAGRYCSQICHYASKQVQRVCKYCKKEFAIAQSSARAGKGAYCSPSCRNIDIGRNVTKTKCEKCGKDIINYKNQNRKYCSKKCQLDAKGIEKICPTCGNIFRARFKQIQKGLHKYCSQKCHYNDHRITKKCGYCGIEFERSIGKNRQYCSMQCARKGEIPWNKDKKYENLKTRKGDYPKCLYCGKVFYRTRLRRLDGQTCCSADHWQLYTKQLNAIDFYCRGCGKKFLVKLRQENGRGTRPHHTFCSDECRRKNYNAIAGYCGNCGKQIKIKRHKLGKIKHPFCSRKCVNEGMTLEASLYGKKGITYHAETGFRVLATKDHYDNPQKDGRYARVYRAEHRVVAEKYLGRKLKHNSEPIYHINGIPTDNVIKNLYIFPTRSELMKVLTCAEPAPKESNLPKLLEDEKLLLVAGRR